MKAKLTGYIVRDDYAKYLEEAGESCIHPSLVQQIVDEANERDEDLELELSSGGGDISVCDQLITAFRGVKNRTKCTLTGIVASAATVLSATFDELEVSPMSAYLIHYPRIGFMGMLRPQELEEITNQLQAITDNTISIYQAKTGLDRNALDNYMRTETMFSAEDTVKLGFADRMIGMPEQVEGMPDVDYLMVYQKMAEENEQRYKAFIAQQNQGEPPKMTLDELIALVEKQSRIIDELVLQLAPQSEIPEPEPEEVEEVPEEVEPDVEEVIEDEPIIGSSDDKRKTLNILGFETEYHFE